MGRKKIEMKLIEDRYNRLVTFSKRKSGLFKKAREISILCGVEVGIVVFSNRGKLYEFCSENSLLNLVERYKSQIDNKTRSRIGTDANVANVANNQYHESNQASLLSLGKLLQTVQSLVNEPNVELLNISDLMQLANQLEAKLNLINSQTIGAIIENDSQPDDLDAAIDLLFSEIA